MTYSNVEKQSTHAMGVLKNKHIGSVSKPSCTSQITSRSIIQRKKSLASSLQSADVLQLQNIIGNRGVAQFLSQDASDQSQTNKNLTGLPDTLKSGVESLSGLSLDNVRVHYNSAEPAKLNALAYAQGTNIHLGSGQEKHLPHEAWHVVQQMQGRVQANTQVGRQSVNDDPSLEKEADRMGTIAIQMKTEENHVQGCGDTSGVSSHPVQMKTVIQMVRLSKSDVKMWEKLVNEAMEAETIGTPKYDALEELYGMIDETADSAVIQAAYNKIMGVAAHPSGYADGTGMLYPKYFDIRSYFFPSGYDLPARSHRNKVVSKRMHPYMPQTWKCPECKSWCDMGTYAGEPTIDHVEDCASYWNRAGYDESKQDRVDFYNDTSNHDIMCRSCNSSKNSGGVIYSRFVGPNFTH